MLGRAARFLLAIASPCGVAGCNLVRKVRGLYRYQMMLLRLTCSAFWVDVRLLEINGRWITSADTPDGPSLGLGEEPMPAIERALEPCTARFDLWFRRQAGAAFPNT